LTLAPADSKGRMDRAHPRIHRWWLVAAAAVVAVVALSLGPDVTPGGEILDSLSHAAAYAALTAVVLAAMERRAPGRWASIVAVAVGLVALGAAMEFAQATVHRDATVADAFADAGGVAFGLTVYCIVRAIHDRRRPARRSTK
jgi:VanZ family protein